MKKIIMPKMPDFKEASLSDKIRIKCDMVSHYGECPGNAVESCNICALSDPDNYRAWKSQQPKRRTIKWPIPDKDRFFVLPRVFVNYMPERWKRRFLPLIKEFMRDTEQIEDNPFKFRVSVTKNGKYVKMPDLFKNMK